MTVEGARPQPRVTHLRSHRSLSDVQDINSWETDHGGWGWMRGWNVNGGVWFLWVLLLFLNVYMFSASTFTPWRIITIFVFLLLCPKNSNIVFTEMNSHIYSFFCLVFVCVELSYLHIYSFCSFFYVIFQLILIKSCILKPVLIWVKNIRWQW